MQILGKKRFMAILLTFPLVLSGCIFQDESSSSVNPPPDDTNYVENGKELEKEKKDTKDTQAKETTSRKLYLVDENGYVTPQVVKLPVPNSNEVAKQALEHLIIDGPVSNLAPNGFQGTIPAGTTVKSLSLKDNGTLTIDFSKEFKSYKASQEDEILQSITWTMTQFPTIDKVKLTINGKSLNTAPVAGTPIEDGMTRKDGINTQLGDVVDVVGSRSVTVFYLAQNDDNLYYVPVTQRVDANKGNTIAATVSALVDGPSSAEGLTSPFGENVSLVSQPKAHNGVLTLNFNKAIYSDAKTKTVSDKVVNTLALSLINNETIDKLSIQVAGAEQVTTESGRSLAKPVTVPTVNKTGV